MKRNNIRHKSRIFQNLTCLLLSLTLLVTGSVTIFAADSGGAKASGQSVKFSDTAGHWAAEYIAEGVEKNWINGYPNGTFKPQNIITRAEFVKLILSAMKLTPGSENAKYFDQLKILTKDNKPYDLTPLSDAKTHWITTSGYMDLALKYGMVINEEYNGGKFQPNKGITRREIAIMAMRALGLVYPSKNTEEKSNYSDAADYPDWLQGYLTMTEKTGVIEGYPDGSFRGENTATRAEALTIVSRVMEEMESGIDESAQIYATRRVYDEQYGNFWSEPKLQELSVPLLKIDGVFYADGTDLYKISERTCTNGIGNSLNPIKGLCWWPEEQKMTYAISWHTTEYVAGDSQMRDIVINDFDDWGTHRYDLGAPKMLYGHLLIPIYDEMRVIEVSDIEGKIYRVGGMEWETTCDDGDRLTMYVHMQYHMMS